VSDHDAARAGLVGLARRAIELWALAGGLLLLAIVSMNAYSLIADILFGKPLPGDFEMVEVGVAVAVFAFLPYCQLTGANVTADIFTQQARPHTLAMLAMVGGLVAFAFSVLLTWCMSLGLVELRQYRETTIITGFPIWMAFLPILLSLALLIVATIISVRNAIADMRSPDISPRADH